jgi:hypothetical protein
MGEEVRSSSVMVAEAGGDVGSTLAILLDGGLMGRYPS